MLDKTHSTKKNLSLKAKEKTLDEGSSQPQDGEVEEDLDMALFLRRFNKYLKKNIKVKDHKKASSDSRNWMSLDKICFECGKYGHFVSNCLEKTGSSS